MFTLKLSLCISLVVVIAEIHATAAIIHRSPYARLKSSQTDGGGLYLNRAHPLWILEDRTRDVTQNAIATTTTARPFYDHYDNYRRQRQETQRSQRSHMRRSYQLPQRIKLPNHYIYNEKQQQQQRNFTPPPIRRQQQQQQQQQQQHVTSRPRLLNMPTFDGMPGGEIEENSRNDDKMVFIYNGPKGQLILNTMLSAHKYPMHEPVPGQTLYPPSAPIFRPKPIVERFRVPESGQMMNLTLIPFYAHEAINPRSITADHNFDLASTTTPATPATVLYAQSKPTALTTTTAATLPTKKPRRLKKARQYSVYRTPDEVQWRPLTADEVTMQLATPPTATTPYTVATSQSPSPVQNHRYGSAGPQEAMPASSFKLSYKVDDDKQFQIVYVDESMEKPSMQATTPIPLLPRSSRYALAREYYAFPVFTLGKLLEPDAEKRVKYATDMTGGSTTSFSPPPLTSSSMFSSSSADTENIVSDNLNNLDNFDNTDNSNNSDNTDTWFILNSRYKGHHKHNDQYRLSSKYIQNSASVDTAPKRTTKTTSAMARVYNRNEFVA